MLTSSNYFVDYIDAVLLDERSALTVDVIYEFLVAFFPKVSGHVLSEQTLTMIDNTVVALSEQVASLEINKVAKRLSGDLRALILVYSSPEAVPPPLLRSILKQLLVKVDAEMSKLKPANSGDKVEGNSYCFTCFVCNLIVFRRKRRRVWGKCGKQTGHFERKYERGRWHECEK